MVAQRDRETMKWRRVIPFLLLFVFLTFSTRGLARARAVKNERGVARVEKKSNGRGFHLALHPNNVAFINFALPFYNLDS